jgi:hypothetical protein
MSQQETTWNRATQECKMKDGHPPGVHEKRVIIVMYFLMITLKMLYICEFLYFLLMITFINLYIN